MTLPADISRCQGIVPNGRTCPMRTRCERYLALMDPVRHHERITVAQFLCPVNNIGWVAPDFPFFIPAE